MNDIVKEQTLNGVNYEFMCANGRFPSRHLIDRILESVVPKMATQNRATLVRCYIDRVNRKNEQMISVSFFDGDDIIQSYPLRLK